MTQLFEPEHDKTNKRDVRSEDSYQPGPLPSLIRVFAVRFIGSKYRMFLHADCEDWTDPQVDLSLR